jgi:hypothetical protein
MLVVFSDPIFIPPYLTTPTETLNGKFLTIQTMPIKNLLYFNLITYDGMIILYEVTTTIKQFT